jgi:hypothetical protein
MSRSSGLERMAMSSKAQDQSRRRVRLRWVRMTDALRAQLERDEAVKSRVEPRPEGRVVRLVDYRHQGHGTRYRCAEDPEGSERWYRIEVVPAPELPPGAVGGARDDRA